MLTNYTNITHNTVTPIVPSLLAETEDFEITTQIQCQETKWLVNGSSIQVTCSSDLSQIYIEYARYYTTLPPEWLWDISIPPMKNETTEDKKYTYREKELYKCANVTISNNGTDETMSRTFVFTGNATQISSYFPWPPEQRIKYWLDSFERWAGYTILLTDMNAYCPPLPPSPPTPTPQKYELPDYALMLISFGSVVAFFGLCFLCYSMASPRHTAPARNREEPLRVTVNPLREAGQTPPQIEMVPVGQVGQNVTEGSKSSDDASSSQESIQSAPTQELPESSPTATAFKPYTSPQHGPDGIRHREHQEDWTP